MNSSLARAAVVCSVCLLTGSNGFAQSFQGGLRGSVMDVAGGVVADAKVSLTDEGAGVSVQLSATAQGEYVFNAVNPATYSVTVEAPGFKKFEPHGIVSPRSSSSLSIKIEVGQVTESVKVTEEVPLIESRTRRPDRLSTARSWSTCPTWAAIRS